MLNGKISSDEIKEMLLASEAQVVIFDDEDIEHATTPDVLNRISPRKIRDLDGCAH